MEARCFEASHLMSRWTTKLLPHGCWSSCQYVVALFLLCRADSLPVLSPDFCSCQSGCILMKAVTHLCAGILFSTLVFGPACGFILGSLCTKFYVNAIFIDTSESWCQFSLLWSSVPAVCWFPAASPQVNWASLPMTRGGSGPGGSASCCAVPYSSPRLSSCLAFPTRCPPGRRKRGRTASTLCFLLLSVQTLRRQVPAMGFSAAMSPPTAPPAASSSEVTVQQPV